MVCGFSCGTRWPSPNERKASSAPAGSAAITSTSGRTAFTASHFGPILPWDEFDPLEARLRAAGVEFVIEPTCRFAGRRGEQMTLFVKDPSGNHLEFKSFRNIEMLFATDGMDYP